MLQIIKRLLLEIVERIDKGTSNLTEEEAVKAIKLLKGYTDKDEPMSKYSACRYLNISRATFDNYVRAGKLPRGKKVIGFTELAWYKKDLDVYIKQLNKS